MDGLPLLTELGRAGGRPTVFFSAGVAALVVATYQKTTPVITVTPSMYITGYGGGGVNAVLLLAAGNTSTNRVQVRRIAGSAPIAQYQADFPMGTKFMLKDGYAIESQQFQQIT